MEVCVAQNGPVSKYYTMTLIPIGNTEMPIVMLRPTNPPFEAQRMPTNIEKNNYFFNSSLVSLVVTEGGLVRQSITIGISALWHGVIGIGTQSCHFNEHLASPFQSIV